MVRWWRVKLVEGNFKASPQQPLRQSSEFAETEIEIAEMKIKIDWRYMMAAWNRGTAELDWGIVR